MRQTSRWSASTLRISAHVEIYNPTGNGPALALIQTQKFANRKKFVYQHFWQDLQPKIYIKCRSFYSLLDNIERTSKIFW